MDDGRDAGMDLGGGGNRWGQEGQIEFTATSCKLDLSLLNTAFLSAPTPLVISIV